MEGLGECNPSFARGLEVLVVDHDTMSLINIAELLEQLAFKVTTTELGSVALSMIESERERSFNLVMANVQMIDMNIFEFIRILLKKNIPVVLTTTSANTKMALKGLEEGASYFYEKPVSLEELRHLWQHVYRRRRNLTESEKSNSVGAEKRKPGRKPKNLKLEEPSGSAKVPKKRGRKPKNKQTEVENIVEVVDCGAGLQEVADEPMGKRKVSEEEVQIMSTDNEYQNKKVKAAETFNGSGSGDLLVPDDPKGKSKQVEEGVRLIEDNDHEPKETPNSGMGLINKDSEVGMEGDQIISMNESAKENAEKEMRDKIMIIAGDKKNRVLWTKELHLKFTQAVSLLGDDKAVPKTILETMNIPNLTHRQVASHLQKYKNQVRQISNSTATPTSPTGPKSSSLNISEFQHVREMTNVQAHEQSQGSLNLGGNMKKSLQKPAALYKPMFPDLPVSFNERLQLASLYINAQNQNQMALPFQGLDIMSANVLSRNQVPLPMQGMEAISGNVMPEDQVPLPMQGMEAISGNVMPGNQVPFPMQGMEAISGNVMPGNQLPFPMQGMEAISGNVTPGNQLLIPTQGLDAMPGHVYPNEPSIAEKYLINFTEENKDLPATNIPAGQGNQHEQHQSLDDYSDILKYIEEGGNNNSLDSGEMDQYLEWLNSDLV